jgi:hypothetical protein
MAEERIDTVFGANAEELVGSLTNIRYLLESITNPIHGVRKSLGELGEAFAAAFALDKIKESIVGLVESMGELAEQTEKLSATLGMSIEQTSEFDGLMRVLGASAESALRPVIRLSEALASNEAGADSPQARALKDIGVSAEELKSHSASATDTIELLRHKFQELNPDMNRTNAFQLLLGRGFEQLVGYLNMTDQEVEEFRQKMADTGSEINGPMMKGMEETGRNANVLGAAFKGIAITLFEAFKPSLDVIISGLTSLVEWFNNAIKEGGDLNATLAFVVVTFNTVIGVVEIAINIFRAWFDLVLIEVQTSVTALVTFGKVMKDVFTGNWSAISSDWNAGWDKVVADAKRHMDDIIDAAKRTAKDLDALDKNLGLGDSGLTVDTSGGGQDTSGYDMGEGGGKRETGTSSRKPPGGGDKQFADSMGEYRNALDQQLTSEGNFFKSSKEEELAFWQAKLAYVQQNQDAIVAEYVAGGMKAEAAQKKAHDLELELDRQVFAGKRAQAAEWLSSYMSGLNEEANDLKNKYNEKGITEAEWYTKSKALAADRLALLKSIGLEETGQFKQALRDQEGVEHEHFLNRKKENAEYLSEYKSGLSEQQADLRDQLSEGLITEREWYAQATALQNAYVSMLKTSGIGAQKDFDASMKQMGAINKQHIDDMKKQWDGFVNAITEGMDQMVSGVLQGTQTWRQAFVRLFDDLALKFIEYILKTAVKYAADQAWRLAMKIATDHGMVASEATKQAETTAIQAKGSAIEKIAAALGVTTKAAADQAKVASTVASQGEITVIRATGSTAEKVAEALGLSTKVGTDQAKVASEASSQGEIMVIRATGAAEEKAAGATTVLGDAAKAFSGAYSATVGIPYVGPIIAPVVAAGAYAAVAAMNIFEVGSWNLPGDQIGMLHKNEMIVPRGPAAAFRSAMSGGTPFGQALAGMSGGSGGAGGGGGDVHLHISTMDAASFHGFLSSKTSVLTKVLANAVRNKDGNLSRAVPQR